MTMQPLITTRGEASATIHTLYNVLTRYDDTLSDTSAETTTTAVSASAAGPTALTLITLILLVLIAAAILICSRASSGYGSYVDEVLRRRDEVTTRLLGRSSRGRKKRKVSGPIEGEDVEMANLTGSRASRDNEGIQWHGSNVLNTSWGWMG